MIKSIFKRKKGLAVDTRSEKLMVVPDAERNNRYLRYILLDFIRQKWRGFKKIMLKMSYETKQNLFVRIIRDFRWSCNSAYPT